MNNKIDDSLIIPFESSIVALLMQLNCRDPRLTNNKLSDFGRSIILGSRRSDTVDYCFTLTDLFDWWRCYLDQIPSHRYLTQSVLLRLQQTNQEQFMKLIYKTQLNQKIARVGWVFKIAQNRGKVADNQYQLVLID